MTTTPPELPPPPPGGPINTFLQTLERITTWKQALIIAFLVAVVAGAILLLRVLVPRIV